MGWSSEDIGDLGGKRAIVTGANSGIGFETVRELARKGADVVLACRSRERGEEAVRRIRDEQPEAKVRFEALDLADLDSVQSFAERDAATGQPLDLLVNNAGVMVPPKGKTRQGFELQLGVNHLGHFALTGRLLPALLQASAPRVVSVSSIAHKQGKMDFDDLDFEHRGYQSWPAYSQSKLANLLFTFELDRRSKRANRTLLAVASHPGISSTNLQRHFGIAAPLVKVMCMAAPRGALPSLMAATREGVAGGDYYGPTGLNEMWGDPGKAYATRRARNAEDGARLWQVSEERTGVRFEL